MPSEIAGVRLTHPDKPLFGAGGPTKADLAGHYEQVAARILPSIKDRLVSLVRCPDGCERDCFFQKHGGKTMPAQLKRKEITEADGGRDEYLYAADISGLVAAVQMSALELHIWGSRIDRLEKPDRLVFDLDPDEELGFSDTKQAAVELRDRLSVLGLRTLPLLTGGKGLHVLAPLERRAEWPQVKAFARGFAQMVAAEQPERYVAQAAKDKRHGRVFIDWLRNERGATAIAPYSTRARKGGPVATPVSWEELPGISASSRFTLADMPERLQKPDPWQEASGWRQSVTSDLVAAVTSASSGG